MADMGRLRRPDDRDRLLAAFPPAYPRMVTQQVAREGKEPPHFPLPGGTEGFVVGGADDGAAAAVAGHEKLIPS
jgi:hypothetical protein